MRPSLRVDFYGLDLLLSTRSDGSWQFETKDLGRLRSELGDDLLAAFLSAFVWCDRLGSAWHFHHLNLKYLEETSVAFGRNLQALTWYSAGVLYESAAAVKELEAAGVEKRLADASHWKELREMAKRWSTDKRLIRVRNNVGFHVSTKLVKRGVATAITEGDRLVIVAGDDRSAGRASRRLGLELLLKGTGMTVADFDALIEIVAADSNRFADLVEHVLLGVLKTSGATI